MYLFSYQSSFITRTIMIFLMMSSGTLHYEMDRVRYIDEHYENYKEVNKILLKRLPQLLKKAT